MPDYYVGLMSGTSVDSIDAALVDFSSTTPRLVASLNMAWPETIREAIFATRQLPDSSLDTLQGLDAQTGEQFALAVNTLLSQARVKPENVTAIGSHGQTIRHRPNIASPFSLQIGNAKRIAEMTGITVISDFRTADIQAGGQGAPLVPGFHRAVFQSTAQSRVIVNIGGIANITVLPKGGHEKITGFDTGPGNNLMDAWIERQKQQPYDRDGKFAASGKTDAHLLATLLMDDYFQQRPPKSTGFETFNLDWLRQRHNEQADRQISPADIQSTLCELTATSIIRAINQYAADCEAIYVCGGGVHNRELMRRLQALSRQPVNSTQLLGVHPDWVEAMTFAWLAKQKTENHAGNVPEVTGAKDAVVLGELTPA